MNPVATPRLRIALRAVVALGAVVAFLSVARPSLADEPAAEQPAAASAVQPADEQPTEAHADRDPPEQARPRARAPRRPARTVRGDLARGWVHVGGGVGATVVDPDSRLSERTARFVLGAGRYVPFFYGGGELQVTGRQSEPLKLTAAGYVGLAPPIPVFHPLIGVRAGAGHHLSDGKLVPHVGVGPQVGFILRQFDGRIGMRLMIDGGVEYRISERELNSELMGTLALVF